MESSSSDSEYAKVWARCEKLELENEELKNRIKELETSRNYYKKNEEKLGREHKKIKDKYWSMKRRECLARGDIKGTYYCNDLLILCGVN